jgi:hypothetical protein
LRDIDVGMRIEMVCGMPFPPSLQERETAHRQPCKKVMRIP